ncbi:MAG: hypothetical protein IT323_06920 [Anaerolineae bacterium]|nr:hypothetical protein [Anaerolineae bacterium]
MSALGAFTSAPSRNTDDASSVNIAWSDLDLLLLAASESAFRPLASLRYGDAASEFTRLLVDRRGFNVDDDDLDEDDFDDEDLDDEDDYFEDDFEDEEFDDDELDDEEFDDLDEEEFEEDDLDDER